MACFATLVRGFHNTFDGLHLTHLYSPAIFTSPTRRSLRHGDLFVSWCANPAHKTDGRPATPPSPYCRHSRGHLDRSQGYSGDIGKARFARTACTCCCTGPSFTMFKVCCFAKIINCFSKKNNQLLHVSFLCVHQSLPHTAEGTTSTSKWRKGTRTLYKHTGDESC